ncbi:MAG: hypothetical protein ACREP6_00030 [Candidatus Binataceae bacterium]
MAEMHRIRGCIGFSSARIWPISTACAIVIAFAVAMAGCAVAPAPLPAQAQLVATPEKGLVTVIAKPASRVGEVAPVYMSVANGTDIPRTVDPSQVFAINSSGERFAPIPPGEAALQAGGAGELKAALESGAVSAGIAGGLGAGIGAAAGSVLGGIGPGALVGGAIAGAEGLFSGVSRGQTLSQRKANQQLKALALKPSTAYRGFTQSGYVFFPKGDYTQVETLLVNRETGDTEDIKTPW